MDERMKRKTMRDYARGVILVDFLVLLATTLIVYLENYRSFQIVDNIYDEGLLRITASPQLVGAGLLVTWLILLSVFKSRDPKIVGSDFSEYRRVLNATLSVLGLLAFVSLYFKVDVSRLYVTEVLVIGLVALLLSRRLGRNWLSKQRKQGNFTRRVAIYGPTSELALELQKYASHKESEFEPIMTIEDNNLLVLKYLNSDKTKTVDLEQLPEVLAEENIEILQVVGSGPSSAQMHKKLYWALDGWDISFVVSPAITGVSSSKLTTRVIAGSPLIKISSTKFSGPQYAIKTAMDLVLGLLAFIVSLPIVLVAALFVKLEDKGPAFFSQTRVGLNGKHFTMYKIRSMKVGAELEHAERQQAAADKLTNSNMYKDPEDPRVTKVGKFIRKYSIDELPQFLNVLKGDMSLVGPRPPLLSEVEEWKQHEVRRLLVKPGVTGPWQIGGRSLLTWEETVAIDLSYVENWTVLNDISIIFKTIGYVFRGRGAY
jgi:exopolysaccharide biosynthesis polyprenyl glycosylphosphotransferase